MSKKELWKNYRAAKIAVIAAKDKARDSFAALFKIDSEVRYRRKVGGKIYTGLILTVGRYGERLKVENIETKRQYWVDSYWLVESEPNPNTI